MDTIMISLGGIIFIWAIHGMMGDSKKNIDYDKIDEFKRKTAERYQREIEKGYNEKDLV